MKSKEVQTTIRKELKNAECSITDKDYAHPSKSWVSERLYSNFSKWLWDNNLDRWETYKDCDNYAFALRVFASLSHAKTMKAYHKMGRKTYQGISIGVMFYKINGDNTRRHAINFMVTGDNQLLYIEPQTGKWLQLTQKEKDSVWFAVI